MRNVCWCKQTLELRKLLEEYLASELASGEWAFVGMIFTTNNKKSSLHSFVTQGCSEVAAKLAVIEDHLKPISVYQTTPSTPRQACSSLINMYLIVNISQIIYENTNSGMVTLSKYASVVRKLVFVVLA